MATKKKADKPPIPPERVEAIKADARSGTNWASIAHPGAACQCGLRAARGICYRHPEKEK